MVLSVEARDGGAMRRGWSERVSLFCIPKSALLWRVDVGWKGSHSMSVTGRATSNRTVSMSLLRVCTGELKPVVAEEGQHAGGSDEAMEKG